MCHSIAGHLCARAFRERWRYFFDSSRARVIWSPFLTREVQQQVRDVTLWLEKECVPGTSLVVDYAKRAHAGVIGPDPDAVMAAIPLVQRFVDDSGLGFDVLPTHLSIDVIPHGITKETGIRWLAAELNLELSEVAYIGDSMGDLKALQQVGRSFAPENAKNELKEAVHCVTAARSHGVLEALQMCIARNQQSVEIEQLNG